LARYNICANVISLGIVTTDMSEKITTDEKLKEIYMNRILLKRFAEPDDISPAFFFSPQMKATTLPVNSSVLTVVMA
jgi:3-oxoacyl-[acyl-carrier protein] reductase